MPTVLFLIFAVSALISMLPIAHCLHCESNGASQPCQPKQTVCFSLDCSGETVNSGCAMEGTCDNGISHEKEKVACEDAGKTFNCSACNSGDFCNGSEGKSGGMLTMLIMVMVVAAAQVILHPGIVDLC